MLDLDELRERVLDLHGMEHDDHDHDDDHDHGPLELPSLWDTGAPRLTTVSEGIANVSEVFSDQIGTELPIDAVEGAFAFGVDVVDTVGGIGADVLEVFQTITELALETWSSFLGSADGASLEVQVNVGGTDAVASAGPGGLFLDRVLDTNDSGAFDSGDFVLAIAGSLLELQTGDDPNGDAADIIVNVNEELLEGGAFFFDTTLTQDVPADQFDFYSVILHELGHGLGFLGLANEPGVLPIIDFGDEANPIFAEVGTAYDFLTDVVDGRPFFTGQNVQAVYGEPAPLEYLTGSGGSDISHFQALVNPDGTATDLRLSLMNPFVIPGDRVEIGNMELALFADIGHELVALADTTVNEFDRLPDQFVPTASVQNNATLDGDQLVFTIGLDQPPPFTTIASGVAVRIEGPTGAVSTSRALIQPGTTTQDVGVDVFEFLGTELTDTRGTVVDAEFSVALFNATQAQLASGGRGEIFTITVEGLFGTTGNDSLVGRSGDDNLVAGSGDDRLIGGNGDDTLDGGDGRDSLVGGNGDDRFFAGDGNDRVIGGNGDDSVLGGGGDDEIITGNGADVVQGEAGNDRIISGNGDDRVNGGDGDDRINTGNGDDLIVAGAGDDNVFAGNGDDTLRAGEGEDFLRAGNGADVFDVSAAEVATIADLRFRQGDSVVFGDGVEATSEAELAALIAGDGIDASFDGRDLVLSFGDDQTVIIDNGLFLDVA